MSLTTELVAGVWNLEASAVSGKAGAALLDLLLDHIGVATKPLHLPYALERYAATSCGGIDGPLGD